MRRLYKIGIVVGACILILFLINLILGLTKSDSDYLEDSKTCSIGVGCDEYCCRGCGNEQWVDEHINKDPKPCCSGPPIKWCGCVFGRCQSIG